MSLASTDSTKLWHTVHLEQIQKGKKRVTLWENAHGFHVSGETLRGKRFWSAHKTREDAQAEYDNQVN